MSAASHCPRCGAELSADAPQDLCPECLFALGMESNTAGEAAAAGSSGLPPGEMATASYDAGSGSVPPSPKVAAELPEPGEQFGSYRLIRRLGKGGMGAVFEADDLETGRRVALKLLAHSLDSTEARNRFFREGRLAASINHPNSVYVYGTGEIDGTPVISMEHVAGGTLAERVRKGGPLPVTVAVDAVLQIIDGLEAAANVGVLHRDVKPSNCFMDADGTVKVGDFGLSISTTARGDTHLTQSGSFLGTPAFSSPEQLRGDDLDVRSDIYAVGVTLFYLLTGRTPYEAENLVKLLATVLEQPPPSPAKFRRDIPQGLAKVVLRCLAKQPSDRFRSYAELRDALVPFNSTAPTPATLALRFVAGACDQLIWSTAAMLVALAWLKDFEALTDPALINSPAYVGWIFATVILFLFYFAVPEGLWGASLGKAICRLRVVDRNRSVIGVPRAALRAAIYIALPNSVVWIYWIASGRFPYDATAAGSWILPLVGNSTYVLLVILFCTARRRNGYAGLHDLAVGARVIRRTAYAVRPALDISQSPLPDTTDKLTIGPYHVLDTLAKTESGEFILGYDTRLLRRVWIHRRPPDAPPISNQQRNMGRVGRLRWINGRRNADEAWDAYEALSGKPLLDLIESPQPWNIVRYWLLDLAGELAAAKQDGTTPEVLALDRVWITAEGRAKLLDFPAPGTAAIDSPAVMDLDGSAESAPQRLLYQVAMSALQGRVAVGEKQSLGNAATRLPLEAHALLQRLRTIELGEICGQMRRLVKGATRVTRARRVAMLATTAALPLFFAAFMGFGMLLVNQWKAEHPAIWELRDCLMNLQWGLDAQAARAANQQERDEIEAQREAMETYVAGAYGDVIRNRKEWDSLYARSVIPEPLRAKAEDLSSRPPPSASELEQAETVIQPKLKEFAKVDKVTNTMFSPAAMALFQFTAMWWIFVVIPGLAAALVFRRGMIMRIFGVDCVTRTGAAASRLRMLWRSMMFNAPVLAAPILFAFVYPAVNDVTASILPIVGLVLAVACWSCLLRQRGLPDRLSGTYTVPT